jgi:hypothetical protein
MKFSRIAGVLVVILLVAPALLAAEDLTGQWSGTFITSMNGGAPKDDVAHMVLKHTGKEIGGSAGPNADMQWPIVKGTITVAGTAPKETTKVAFDVQMGEGPLLHFDLDLIDGHLKGNAKAEMNGMTMTAVVDVTRLK